MLVRLLFHVQDAVRVTLYNAELIDILRRQ